MDPKLIRRFLPDPAFIKDHPSLQWLGKTLHDPNLWHLNRHSVSKAFLVGIFCALMPIPFQMVAAAMLSILIHSHLALSVALVWITNPVSAPVIFFLTYKLGAWILDLPKRGFHIELSWQWVTEGLIPIWQPLLLGSFICALLGSLTAYLVVNKLWRIRIRQRWQTRQQIRIKRRLNEHLLQTGAKKHFVPATIKAAEHPVKANGFHTRPAMDPDSKSEDGPDPAA